MNPARHLAIGATLAAACATCVSCKAPPAPSTQTASESASSAQTAPALPADRLAPGELLEGPERAFGVPLPEGMSVDAKFSTAAYARGPMPVHALVDYFRARLLGGDLREGDRSATFDHVTAVGKPTPPLSIHIGLVGDTARVQIRDETPPVLPALPDDASRWKRAGLTPSGRLIDPTHLD